MSAPNFIVNPTLPWVQYVATAAQTVFIVPFLFINDSDLAVYLRADANTTPDDSIQKLDLNIDYTVTGQAQSIGGQITLTNPASAGNIVTILDNALIERLTNFVDGALIKPSSLDFQIDRLVALIKQVNMFNEKLTPRYWSNSTPNNNTDLRLPILEPLTIWRKNQANTEIELATVPENFIGGLGGLGTDNHIVRWDGTGQPYIKNSPVLLTDGGEMSGVTEITMGTTVYSPADIISASTFDVIAAGDVSIQNVVISNTDAITGVTELDVDNININGNTISSTDTNGDINLVPDGTGQVTVPLVPTSNSSAASKSYVDGLISNSANNCIPVNYASTVNFNAVYDNGASGVGATLTSAVNQVFVIDGVTANLNEIVLIKNQTNSEENGVYFVADAGSGSSSWILERAPSFDEVFQMSQGVIFPVVNGDTNFATIWQLTSVVTTIGTDALNIEPSVLITPATTSADSIARFKGFDGKEITDSLVTISDTGEMGGLTQLNLGDIRIENNTISVTDTDADLNINANGTGNVIISGVDYPNTTGNTGDVLTLSSATVAVWAPPSGGGGGGETTSVDILQTGHGFVAGDVIYYNGTSYAKAIATSPATAEVVGIVSTVADANNFTLVMSGYVTGLSSLVPGDVYFLSTATAGELVATEPVTIGHVRKPLFVAITSTEGYFINYRGDELTVTAGAAPAVKADQEAGTSGIVFTNPAVQQFHPSAAKAWCMFDGTTTGTNPPTIGYNITSVQRVSSGLYQLNFTTNFSTANYCVNVTTKPDTGGLAIIGHVTGTPAVGNCRVLTIDNTFVATDATRVYVTIFGDQ